MLNIKCIFMVHLKYICKMSGLLINAKKCHPVKKNEASFIKDKICAFKQC